MKLYKSLLTLCVVLFAGYNLSAQISPGELANVHAYLEGVSNCTKCHDVGNKVTREKCLACHDDIKQNIINKKGYHASAEVKGKACVVCHNDHHGRNFKIIRFDKKTFKHSKAGFDLKGAHAKQECKACHKPAFIKDARLKTKSTTYLGLSQQCLSCHDDYHQGKLSRNCTECHGFDSFENATGFNHSKTRFPLLGKHQTVDCKECHKTEIIKGKTVQKFTGLKFDNCTACHKDVHNNKFGQDCKKCHSEESFHLVRGIQAFDHDQTDYKLVGKHKSVGCKECHKTSMTTPLKHDRCTDCHTDYHNKEFAKNGVSPDCITCHTTNGFMPSSFTIEKHNLTKFKLDGAHLATSCTACHKKGKDWTFKNMGTKCVDCHKNEHKGFIADKFYPNQECTACHSVKNWNSVNFDHNKTSYKLIGAHAKAACSDCHYRRNENGVKTQQFVGTPQECTSCHSDSHYGQFAIDGKTDCARCHNYEDWHDTTFDHNSSRFKLDGRHKNVKCEECHKPVMNQKGKYIEYKFDDISCSKCHKN